MTQGDRWIEERWKGNPTITYLLIEDGVYGKYVSAVFRDRQAALKRDRVCELPDGAVVYIETEETRTTTVDAITATEGPT